MCFYFLLWLCDLNVCLLNDVLHIFVSVLDFFPLFTCVCVRFGVLLLFVCFLHVCIFVFVPTPLCIFDSKECFRNVLNVLNHINFPSFFPVYTCVCFLPPAYFALTFTYELIFCTFSCMLWIKPPPLSLSFSLSLPLPLPLSLSLSLSLSLTNSTRTLFKNTCVEDTSWRKWISVTGCKKTKLCIPCG